MPAGLCAALLLAVMPVAVAVDRSNNTNSWLVFFLLLAAAAALRGRGLSLVAAMALLGVAFNVKMLAALICGPALLTGWWLAGTLDWRRRLGWMAAAGVTLGVVSLAWAVAFDLTPKDSRPYAGSSHDNSMLELIVVHNGLERFVRAPRTPTRAGAHAGPAAAVRSLRRRARRALAARGAGACRAVRLDPAAGRAGRRVRLAATARLGGAVERLGAHLRHRLQRRRRHLPRLLSGGPGAAARRAGGHRLLRAVASRAGSSRARACGHGALAGLHRRRIAGLGRDLDRLPAGGSARGRGDAVARQAAARR